jgi:hypothetical protein
VRFHSTECCEFPDRGRQVIKPVFHLPSILLAAGAPVSATSPDRFASDSGGNSAIHLSPSRLCVRFTSSMTPNLPHTGLALTVRGAERSESFEMSGRRSVRGLPSGCKPKGPELFGRSAHAPETGRGAKPLKFQAEASPKKRFGGLCTTPGSLTGNNDRKTGRSTRGRCASSVAIKSNRRGECAPTSRFCRRESFSNAGLSAEAQGERRRRRKRKRKPVDENLRLDRQRSNGSEAWPRYFLLSWSSCLCIASS